MKRVDLPSGGFLPIAGSIMAVSISRDDGAARLLLTISGVVTIEDIAYVLPFLREGEARGYTVLWDARLALPRFFVGDLRRMQSLMVALDAGTPKSARIALVASDESVHAFGKAVALMISAAGYPIAVFKSMSDAERWLAGEPDVTATFG